MLQRNPPKLSIYGVITTDLVHSRKVVDRVRMQERLTRLVRSLNSTHKSGIAAPFMIAVGMKFEGWSDGWKRFQQ